MLTETHRFRLHGSARCVALSQAEDVLAVGLMNAEIALCDLDRLDDIVAGQKPGSDGEPPTGEGVRTLEGASSVTGLAFRLDGEELAAAGSARVAFWDARSGRASGTLAGHESPVTALAYTRDREALITASSDELLRVFSAEERTPLKTIETHQDAVSALAISFRGHVVSASEDQSIRFWDIEHGQTIQRIAGLEGKVVRLAFSPDSELLAAVTDEHTVYVWDIATRIERRVLRYRDVSPTSVAFLDDSRFVVGQTDGAVRVVDALDAEDERLAISDAGVVDCVVRRGEELITVHSNREVRVHDIAARDE